VLAVLLAGCAGGSGNGGDGGPPESDASGDGRVPADLQAGEGLGSDQAEEPPPGCNPNWVLEVFNFEDGISLEVGKKYAVEARLVNPTLGTSVQGETIQFALSGEGDASLTDTSAVTSEFGIAGILVDAGTQIGVTYTITVSHPCTASDSATFNSIEPQSGSVTVTVTVPDEVLALVPDPKIVVYADANAGLCAAVDVGNPGGLAVQVPDGTDTVEIPHLLVGPGYTVTAVAENPAGLPVASACQQKVVVLTGKTTQVALTLSTVTIDPAGKYELELTLSLSDLLPALGTAPEAALLDLLNAAAPALSQAILDDLAVWFPDGYPEDCGDVPAEVTAGIAAALAALPGQEATELAAQAPAWMAEWLNAVVVAGTLDVSAAAQPGSYDGTITYGSVSYSGKPPCADPGCSSLLTVTADQFDQSEVHFDWEKDPLVLNASGIDGLVVPAAGLSLSAGRIALRAFSSLALAGVGQDAGLSGLLASAIDCDAAVAAIKAETLACIQFNAPQTDPLASCIAYRQALPAQLFGLLQGYAGPQGMEVSGPLVMQDPEPDLDANALEGVLSGAATAGGADIGTIDIGFKAIRQ
jgi:hypothetical protein